MFYNALVDEKCESNCLMKAMKSSFGKISDLNKITSKLSFYHIRHQPIACNYLSTSYEKPKIIIGDFINAHSDSCNISTPHFHHTSSFHGFIKTLGGISFMDGKKYQQCIPLRISNVFHISIFTILETKSRT